jgi:hypothetical protein
MVTIIQGTDAFNKYMVGNFVKHHTVTCYLCHKQLMTVDGTRKENIKRLEELGWFKEKGVWFCPKHIFQDLSFIGEDDD